MALDIWGVASTVVKFLLYLSIIGLAGAVIFNALFKEAKELVPRRHYFILTFTAIALTLLSYSLRGAALTGDVSGLVDMEMLGILWQTPVGNAFIYRMSGLALILISLMTEKFGPPIGITGTGLVFWSFSQIGHATDVHLPFISVLFFIHYVGVAFWVGALAPLHKAATGGLTHDTTAAIAEKFGRLASIMVPILIVAGTIMSWLLVGSFENLLGTSYGQLLLIKVLIVSVLLLLAAANKFRFVPRLLAGQSGAAAHLAKSIKYETAIVLIIFLMTAVLTSTLSLPK